MFDRRQRRVVPLRASTDSPLSDTQFLSAFAPGDARETIETSAQAARAVPPHTSLSREGEPCDQLFVLTQGWACRYKTLADGRRQIVGVIVPGEIANLDSLLRRQADFGVRTMTNATKVALSCDTALDLIQRDARVAAGFMALTLRDNAILSQMTLCLGRQSALQRLAHLICELGLRLNGAPIKNGSRFTLPLTQEQLADALGLTSVHVNRTMQRLRRDEMIRTDHHIINILDAHGLMRLAEFDPAYLLDHARETRQAMPFDVA